MLKFTLEIVEVAIKSRVNELLMRQHIAPTRESVVI